MMKILIIFLTIPFICFPQDEKKQDQNVELPEFVITGNESVSIEKAKKIDPDFGSAVSEEFLKPALPAEQLEVRDFVNPVKENINLKDSVHYNNGRFNAGIGSLFIPKADILFTNPFNDGIFEWFASTDNRRAYVSNSDGYSLRGGLNLSLFTKNNSAFLPGTEIKFHGNYKLSSYKFYGSELDPSQRRTLNSGNVSININNTLDDYFIFAAYLDNRFNSLKNENFSENFLRFKGFGKFTLDAFNLSFDVLAMKQFLNNNNINAAQNGFLGIAPKIGLNLSETFRMNFGLNYSQSLGNIYFTPYASAALKLDNNLSFFGEFAPHADLLSAYEFLGKNPYLNAQTLGYSYVRYSNSIKLAFKYEFEKYFQINAGFNVIASTEMPYYKNSKTSGKFDVAYDDARVLTGFVDMLFHAGPFGYFYGNAEFNASSDTANHSIPYIPASSASLIYGYNFASVGLNSELILKYNSSVYIDIPNLTKLQDNIDLGVKFDYQYKPGFLFTLEFSNLLFRDNYQWSGYKEIPFNITAGISLIW